MRFGIRNKQTKVVMVLTYDMETRGREYMTYERPQFYVEEMTDVTSGMPIWTTDSADVAQKVIYECYDGRETISFPKIEKSHGENGIAEYEVFTLKEDPKGERNIQTLSVTRLQKAHVFLMKTNPGKPVTVAALAKEVAFKASAVFEFIENNSGNFKTSVEQVGRSRVLCIKVVYDQVRDNPEMPEYLDFRIKINKRTIQLSYYNNYGYISGYYIEPSSDVLESKYMNTIEKVEQIAKDLSLKKACYSIGGFGDSSTIYPKNGYEISFEQIEKLLAEGWIVLGEYHKKPDIKSYNGYNTYKYNKR